MSPKKLTQEERNKQIIALRESGATLAQIGSQYKLTKARIAQIAGQESSAKRLKTEEEIQLFIARFFAEKGTYPSFRYIADAVEASSSYVTMLIKDLSRAGKVRLSIARDRIYIAGVKPPKDVPEDMRKQVIEQLDTMKKEWVKK